MFGFKKRKQEKQKQPTHDTLAWVHEEYFNNLLPNSASSFMNQQIQYASMMDIRLDMPIVLAFAYGTWDSVTQHLNNPEFETSHKMFVDKWYGKDATIQSKIDVIIAMRTYGNDDSFRRVVQAGGQAYQLYRYGEGNFSPVQLARCLKGKFD